MRWMTVVSLLFLLPNGSGAEELEVDGRFPDRFETVEQHAYRISALSLRDPHLFVEVDFGFPLCLDATDSPGFDLPGFNEIINETINEDSTDDGFLDASPLLVFSPVGWPSGPGRLRLADGECTAPAAGTSCVIQGESPGVGIDSRSEGLCRGPLKGTVRPYNPPVSGIEGPCFAGPAQTLELALDDLLLGLNAASISGSWQGLDDGQIAPGLLRGFMAEKVADALLIPEEIDLIGGQPLSSLLPGGAGNCNSGDDRSEFDGVMGWWFYFEYQAEQVMVPGS